MTSKAEINASRAIFTAGENEVNGYLALPANETPSAAVIVIQEWWGLNRHIEDIAERYAAEGFIAAAPDLYKGTTTKDASEAGQLMQGLNQAAAIDDLLTVVAHLRAIEGIEAVGVTGYCMGGTFALLLPCYTRLEASVPFYGDVPEDTAILANLSCPVLFIGGEKDEWINVPKMKRLEDAFKHHHKPGEVHVYPGAPHAFFNDTRPEVYKATEAADAWKKAIDFFNRHLRKGQTATSA